MAFHVTLFGPSCCEIQYKSCLEDDNNLENVRKKKNPRKETESASQDLSYFVSHVEPSTLRYDSLYLPMSFTRANGLRTRCGEIFLMNEKVMYITRGWKSFCCANGLKAGDLFTFKLNQRGKTLVLRLSSTESESEEESSEGDEVYKKISKRDAESSSIHPSCYVANVTPSGLRDDRMFLRRSFVMENGLETRFGETVLMNEKGRSWTLKLNRKSSCGTMSISGGWRSFCKANGLRAGSFFTFKLIQTGGTLVLRLSSQFQNRFVTLTLKPYDLQKRVLFLPTRFTKMHGVNEETKMTMLDKNDVKWSTDLRSNNRGNRIRLVGGWQEFFRANCVKTDESVIVKLIWEGKTSCVLKFCSKVKQEIK
ncbi:hypothetical protein Bca52824_026670 [Brassica carinata]|uniref:TF-B3 domain-containing protein n=1 Tax=Brassica carinata TaxID=52824 RepID=A0A8X7SII5_BRACI|nr:hypothetical protein Bca52824_026670 [Brassica carinata]